MNIPMASSPDLSRRDFLRRIGCGGMSALPVLSSLLNLRLTEGLASASVPTSGEYRALVCILLGGGNDSFNMLVPRDPEAYGEYRSSRGGLALAPEQLIDIHPQGLPPFALHGAMPELADLFESGQAAFVANVGTLIEPVQNRAQVDASLKRLPLGLYSHSDQIEQWQTSIPHSRSGIGWGGRMADLLKDLNRNPVLPMQISLDGGNVWQTGRQTAEYAITPDGATALNGYSAGWEAYRDLQNALSSAVDSQLSLHYTNLLSQTFNVRKRQALEAYQIFADATSKPLPEAAIFPFSPLGQRLAMVARAIQGRTGTGAVRQTFFIQFAGWDHHSDVLTSQAEMLPQVSQALGAFQRAMNLLGVQDQVTLFTASDFGRTLTSNGRGSDHAWGGNQIVMGGAVKGRRIHGSYPSLAINPENGAERNPLDTGRGRLIPTTSCDAFFAELALWLGVRRTDLTTVFPNLGNFLDPNRAIPPVGFLNLDT